MNILFAAHENSWGGFFDIIRSELPQHCFEATGKFQIDSLKGIDVLIPTMSPVTEKIESIAKEFEGRMVEAMKATRYGDPLKDADLDMGPLVSEEHRITSYNVCYTKLLRPRR